LWGDGIKRWKIPSSYAAKVIYLDEEAGQMATHSGASPANISEPENLANVMYTAGSTGTPKGVTVAHQGIIRLVKTLGMQTWDRRKLFYFLVPPLSTFPLLKYTVPY
jgi:surfactin family lipopeptide synthetase C